MAASSIRDVDKSTANFISFSQYNIISISKVTASSKIEPICCPTSYFDMEPHHHTRSDDTRAFLQMNSSNISNEAEMLDPKHKVNVDGIVKVTTFDMHETCAEVRRS